jgi:hypothetical protein
VHFVFQPLDRYCNKLKVELEMITGQTAVKAADWLDSPLNRPLNFASHCTLTATELGAKSVEDVGKILAENSQGRTEQLARG